MRHLPHHQQVVEVVAQIHLRLEAFQGFLESDEVFDFLVLDEILDGSLELFLILFRPVVVAGHEIILVLEVVHDHRSEELVDGLLAADGLHRELDQLYVVQLAENGQTFAVLVVEAVVDVSERTQSCYELPVHDLADLYETVCSVQDYQRVEL